MKCQADNLGGSCNRCGTSDYLHLYLDTETQTTFCSECQEAKDWEPTVTRFEKEETE